MVWGSERQFSAKWFLPSTPPGPVYHIQSLTLTEEEEIHFIYLNNVGVVYRSRLSSRKYSLRNEVSCPFDEILVTCSYAYRDRSFVSKGSSNRAYKVSHRVCLTMLWHLAKTCSALCSSPSRNKTMMNAIGISPDPRIQPLLTMGIRSHAYSTVLRLRSSIEIFLLFEISQISDSQFHKSDSYVHSALWNFKK